MSTMMHVGSKFKTLRLSKSLTLLEVSISTKIDTPLLSKIERGERVPTSEQVEQLCSFYNIELDKYLAIQKADKILKKYGYNESTIDAVLIVKERIEKYVKK